ncbi:MAG TPA: hypothetical protein VHC47_08785, partial [Mucilaginibacter sp.]|nr:hypothetical protein [Mucilaginibacter sp.]
RTQVKIFTDRYFAYAGMAPDSSVGFGVGRYQLDTGNRIIEYNIYSSRALDSTQIFHIKMTRTDSGYTQVIPDLATVGGVKYSETEVYSKVPSASTSKIDGLWLLDSAYSVKGKDTTVEHEVQYKIYWGGHFLFVHRYRVIPQSPVFKNGFGYGTFSLENDTLSEEDDLTNHAVLLNRQFAIKINFRSENEYTQVITDDQTGERSVEVYKKIE